MEGVEQHLAGRKSGATVAPEKATDALRYKELTQPNMFMWPWEKKKSVFWGLVKMAILDWGNDLESENNDIKAMTSSYLTEIGVLAALVFTVQVGFLQQPGTGGSFEGTPVENWLNTLYIGVWATASFVTLCSVLACVVLLVLLSKIPDKSEHQDPAKYFMIRIGVIGRLPLFLFVMGVPVLSSLGCILWLFTALDWLAALFIAIGNATLAAVIGFGGGLAMVGALYDTLKAIRSDNIPSSAQMRMRLGTL